MITQHEFGTTTWMDVFDPTSEELESLDKQFGLGDRTFDEARRRAARKEEIDDLVRNPVAHLVGVALGNRLGGEEVV